jgi:hypothetical protein
MQSTHETGWPACCLRHLKRSLRLKLVASISFMSFGCAGIDGLPDAPLRPDAGSADNAVFSTGDAGTDAASALDASTAVDGSATDAGSTDAFDATVPDAAPLADASAPSDAGPAIDATFDSGPCVPETDGELCASRGRNCGRFETLDRCGTTRVVPTCGVCTSFYETCGGGGINNVCGCAPESNWSFCWRLGATCGSATGTDNCGVTRTVTCGGACPVDAGTPDAGLPDAGAPDASTVQRWTFSNCGATGANGPTQTQCDAAYTGTSLSGVVSLNAGIQSWSVPASGRYRITAMGAEGGDLPANDQSISSGRGALIQGEFEFTVGSAFRIVVGQAGSASCGDLVHCGGGGGGSFVVASNGDPLVVAGGGGGTCWNVSYVPTCACSTSGIGGSDVARPGCAHLDRNLRCSETLTGVRASCGYQGGSFGDAVRAGSGGGLLDDGSVCQPESSNRASGNPFARGAGGGGSTACRSGGFGGGGTGGASIGGYSFGGGGGGGYSGGSMGAWRDNADGNTQRRPGSGGASFSAGLNPANFTGYRAGHGLVVIERLP